MGHQARGGQVVTTIVGVGEDPRPLNHPPEVNRSDLRAQALARDGRCVWCAVLGYRKDRSDILELAHLRGVGVGGRKSADTLDGVLILDRVCHDMLDGRQMSGRREAVAGLLAHIVRTRPPA